MRITRIMVILLIGALLTVVACAPAPTTPAPTPTPTQPAPTTPAPTPTPTQPAPTTPAPTTPAPTQPGTGPAAFTLSNLTLPWKALPYEKVTIGVTVKNTGGESGTYKVVMKVLANQTKTEDAQSQDVTLAGGASQEVTFFWTAGPAESYTVTIDKLTETLEVFVYGGEG